MGACVTSYSKELFKHPEVIKPKLMKMYVKLQDAVGYITNLKNREYTRKRAPKTFTYNAGMTRMTRVSSLLDDSRAEMLSGSMTSRVTVGAKTAPLWLN